MKVVKKLIKKIFRFFGYESISNRNDRVRFEIFANMATAYEQAMNDSGELILPNKIRLKLLTRLLGTPPSEAYFLIKEISTCKNLAGDVCEFGVAQGETSALIANEILSLENKNIHLFDSFEGLPKPTDKDQLKDDIFSLGNIEAYTGKMSCNEEMVESRLKAISFPTSRIFMHKGFIEKILYEDRKLPKAVCFAYVDFDFYEPIKLTLEYLHNVTPIGAVIIVDDYNYFSTGAKTAVDEFIETKNSEKIIYECVVPDTNYGHFAVLKKKA